MNEHDTYVLCDRAEAYMDNEEYDDGESAPGSVRRFLDASVCDH